MILTEDEKKEIISRSIYWDEVNKREGLAKNMILKDELIEIVRLLGIKILWVLKEYAYKL